MEIKTKFNINQIVQHKYQRASVTDKLSFAMEVIEISTVTCSAGTQNFYICRLFFGVHKGYGETKQLADIGFSTGENHYSKLREDELKEAPQEIINILENKKPAE